MKNLLLSFIPLVFISCIPGKVIHQEFEILDNIQLKPKQFVIREGAKHDYLKINTGNQDIIFALPKQTERSYTLSGKSLQQAYPFAVHYKGSVCKEGNFKCVKGSLKATQMEDGLQVELDMTSVKYPHGLKTEADLKKLLKVKSADTCEWTYSALMTNFDGKPAIQIKH